MYLQYRKMAEKKTGPAPKRIIFYRGMPSSLLSASMFLTSLRVHQMVFPGVASRQCWNEVSTTPNYRLCFDLTIFRIRVALHSW